jgi:hypothetical protein
MTASLISRILIFACMFVPATADAEVRLLLTDFKTDVPDDQFSPDSETILRFIGVRDLPNGQQGDLFVRIARPAPDADPVPVFVSADYNQISRSDVAGKAPNWTFTIHPDTPRPRTLGIPNPPDVFQFSQLSLDHLAEQTPFAPDPTPSMPPWRKDDLNAGGYRVTGVYRLMHLTEPASELFRSDREGVVVGSWQPRRVGQFHPTGNIVISPVVDGMRVRARLAPTRVQSPASVFAMKQLATPQDWTRFDKLRLTVSSADRRDDVAVSLRIRQADGPTRIVTSAGLLRSKPMPFDVDLSDIDLDLSRVDAFGVGVDNPFGVGDVEFVIHQIELIDDREPEDQAPVRLTLDATTRLRHGSTEAIHKGLFGFHDVGESDPRPPAEGELPADEYLRLLKPGLLRPLTHTSFRVPYVSIQDARRRATTQPAQVVPPRDPTTRPTFQHRASAGDALDSVVWTHTQDLWNRPGWMDDRAGARSAVENYFRELAVRASKGSDDANPIRRIEFWNEPFMWARHTNMGKLQPAGVKAWVDPTQYGYYPGKLGADAWSDLFLAAHTGARDVGLQLLIGGPSSPEFAADHFAVLDNYVARILRRVGHRIDFLTEHHYGGDPRTFAAGFDVMTAWCDLHLGRRIPIINTEANNLGAGPAGKASYNVADILHCIRYTPEFVQGRALHALWNGYLNDSGELAAYTFLAPLRGQFISVSSSHADVVSVASFDGGQVHVVAFNAGRTTKDVSINLPDTASATMLITASSGPELELKDAEGQPIANPAEGSAKLVEMARGTASIRLPAGSAIRWSFDAPAPTAVRDVRQLFFDRVLLDIAPGRSIPLSLNGDPLPGATRARLRVVTRDVHPGEASITIGDRVLALPTSSGNDASAIIHEIELDPSLVMPGLITSARCDPGERSNGFTIYSASIILEK